MPFADVLADTFSETLTLDAYAVRLAAAAGRFGLQPGNSLALVGVCRDELTNALIDRLERDWGPTFRLTSMAGMVLSGHSGMRAAAQHAPESDGSRRFLLVAMPHIGINRPGEWGQVQRPGQELLTSACGALVSARAELLTGATRFEIDPLDIEQSLLKRRLRSAIPGQVPDLLEVTRKVRDLIRTDLLISAGDLLLRGGTDVAVTSGILIHTPAGDRIAPGRLEVHNNTGSDRAEPSSDAKAGHPVVARAWRPIAL